MLKKYDHEEYDAPFSCEKDECRILVISDSHGSHALLRHAIGRELPFDLLIHCGDVEGDLERILGDFREYGIRAVRGNMDRGSMYPPVLELEILGVKIFAAHGDAYGAKFSDEGIEKEALRRGAKVALFGHSHVPEVRESEGGILLINPGSIARPHQEPRKRTYALLTVKKNEDPKAEILAIPDYIPGIE